MLKCSPAKTDQPAGTLVGVGAGASVGVGVARGVAGGVVAVEVTRAVAAGAQAPRQRSASEQKSARAYRLGERSMGPS
jgi:hypothetical protein